MAPERVVSFRPRAILSAVGVLLGVAVALEVVWVARTVVTWVLVALFLALALNPAVEWLHRRTGRGRGIAVGHHLSGSASGHQRLRGARRPDVVDQFDSFVPASRLRA